MSRNYHSMTTKFNVAFNGNESYKEGLKKIQQANEDDFSTVIPLYPISRHSNANSASSDMDRAIEKSRKAIKTHSIKKKPKKDNKRSRDPEYMAYYNQNEFNKALKDAWLLIGKAEFHKADFLGSIGTFSYITRHYAEDKNVIAQAQLWMVRAYAELDWLYEAEQILQQVNPDDLKGSQAGLLASANAVVLTKRGQYKEAIPFVEIMISREKDKALKQRFTYVLAQLYEETNDKNSAIDAYSSVIKMNPPYIMDFNARINRAQLSAEGNMDKVLKDLRKMAKNSNNKDYLDQIYYVIGNTYLHNGDTINAIENYNLAVENSTRNGIEKAITLITLGDLYYGDRKYVPAQPAFDDASKIITNEYDDYARVSKLAEVLGELASQYQIVVWQDTLQYLGALSETERMGAIQKMIDEILEEERKAQEKEAALAQAALDNSNRFVPIGGPAGGNTGKWYFYNQNQVRTGKSDFQSKWGTRKLEDNWRRANKSASLFADYPVDDLVDPDIADPLQAGDTLASSAGSASAGLADNKNPDFYLRQIPFTAEQIAQSNAQIADALFNMGRIYKDKLHDFASATETYEEFIRRFREDERVPDAYFQLYLIAARQGDLLQAENYRMTIIQNYPDTRYAQLLSQPDYIERYNLMIKQQDSLYYATYQAYSMNEFRTVSDNTQYARDNFPLSNLMPKFMFLEALSIGKTDTPENFENALTNLVEIYPQSEVSAMAKDIIALIRQGREAQIGTSHGSLLAKREEVFQEELEEDAGQSGVLYSDVRQGKHRLMLISSAEQQQMYEFMYQIAAYNFTRFMIKEFDLLLNTLGDGRYALSVTNFESYDEVLWYINSINTDLTLGQLINNLQIQEVAISEANFGLINALGLDEYLVFQAQSLPKTSDKSLASIPQPEFIEFPEETVENNTPQPDATVASAPSPSIPDTTNLPIPESAPEPVQPTVEPTVEEKTPEEPVAVETPTESPAETATPPVPTPKEEELELYQGLFAYEPEAPHVVGMFIISGKINFDKFKSDIDRYNAENYGMLNLEVSQQQSGRQSMVVIGNFTDANIAQSYLLRIVNEKALLDGLKGSNYRNVLGTQRNIDVLLQKNALNTYLSFMQQYYFK